MTSYELTSQQIVTIGTALQVVKKEAILENVRGEIIADIDSALAALGIRS
jgi:hypothetical protein